MTREAMTGEREALRAVCYRLRTGEPERKWSWQNCPPSQGTLDLAAANGWTIEYAYAAPPAVEADALSDAACDYTDHCEVGVELRGLQGGEG